MSKIIEICEDIIHIQKMKRRTMDKIAKEHYPSLPLTVRLLGEIDKQNARMKDYIGRLVKTSGMDMGEVFPELPNGTMIIKRASVGPTMMETPIIKIKSDQFACLPSAQEAGERLLETMKKGRTEIAKLSEAIAKESELIRVVNTKCVCRRVNTFQESKAVGNYDVFTVSCCKTARVETLYITREELNELIKTAKGKEYIKKWDEIPDLSVHKEKIVASEDSPGCGA